MSALLTALVLQAALVTPPQNEFETVYNAVEQAIRTRYYARTARRDEMNAAFTTYGPRAKAAKDRAEFTAVLDEMIESFGDSHFAFLPDDRQAYYTFDALANRNAPKLLPNIGVWFAPHEQGYRVRMVLNGSTADNAGLRPNDIVTVIDGQPFTPVESLRPHIGQNVALSFIRNEKTYETQVRPTEQIAIDMFFDATRRSARIVEVDGKRIAYLRVWTMVDRKFRDFLETFATRGGAVNSDAFVYDLRDGFGGRPEGYYEPFFAPNIKLEFGIGNVRTTQITGYSNPVVVLTNPGTRSAKEVVSQIFKTSQRATLVGGPSAGDVLGTTPLRIADWAYLEIPMVELTVDGQTLEKNPVQPDLPYGLEFNEEGEDLYLQRALEEAARLAAQTNSSER